MKKGFTLIEIMVVLSILGILIALMVPAVAAARRNAIRAEEVREIEHTQRVGEAQEDEFSLEAKFQQNRTKWVVFEIDGKKMAAPKDMVIELEVSQGILD